MFRGILAVRKGDLDATRAVIDRLEKRAESGEMTSVYAGFAHFVPGDTDRFVAYIEDAFRINRLPFLELLYSPIGD